MSSAGRATDTWSCRSWALPSPAQSAPAACKMMLGQVRQTFMRCAGYSRRSPAVCMCRISSSLRPRIRGFIPAGQTGTQRGTDLRKHFKAGKVLDTKVIDVDPRTGEPKLSIRGYAEEEERRAHKEYRQKLKAEGGFGTLGDLLKQRLSGARDE